MYTLCRYADIMQTLCRLSYKCASGSMFCCYMPSVHRVSCHTLMHTFCGPMQSHCRLYADFMQTIKYVRELIFAQGLRGIKGTNLCWLKRLQLMPRFGPKTRLETEDEIKLERAAQEITHSHCRSLPTLGDFREAQGNPSRCGDRQPASGPPFRRSEQSLHQVCKVCILRT